MNRAVSVGMRDGAVAGLALLDDLATSPSLQRNHLLHSARAQLLVQVGQNSEAAAAFRRALDLARTEAERAFYAEQLATEGHDDRVR